MLRAMHEGYSSQASIGSLKVRQEPRAFGQLSLTARDHSLVQDTSGNAVQLRAKRKHLFACMHVRNIIAAVTVRCEMAAGLAVAARDPT
jgi:hypothetical protein